MKPVSVYRTSMASGATSTTAIDLQHSWSRIHLVIPTMTSGGDIYLLASDSLTGTYRRVFHDSNTNSAVVGAHYFTSVVTNCIIPLHNVQLQYLKVELTTAAADQGFTFKFICSY